MPPLPPFRDSFVHNDPVQSPFSLMTGAVIGVEATSYLKQLTDENSEPLLAALGGGPLALKEVIETELSKWKDNSMRPLFIFDGQPTVGQEETNFRIAQAAHENTEAAWSLYTDNKATEAVKSFGASSAIRPQQMYSALQEVLLEQGLEFLTAPFSACAQLSAMTALEEQYIDGIMGSQDLLLYKFHGAFLFPPSPSDWEKKSFRGVDKGDIMKQLNTTPSLLQDALFMVGTSILPPFPRANHITGNNAFNIKSALNVLNSCSKSVQVVCQTYADHIRDDPNWYNNYMKAKMAVNHCITVRPDGSYAVEEFDTLTQDSTEYLGIQLPPELYSYLASGLIGSRVLNYITWSHAGILVHPTLDGVSSNEYKRLLTESLLPLKEYTTSLIASRCHRGIAKGQKISLRFWFKTTSNPEIIYKDREGETNAKADTWGVKDPELNSIKTPGIAKPGSLSYAALSLQDDSFPPKTISKAGQVADLKSQSEVISSALWRLMHLRGYVNDKHELTVWGKALAKTFQEIGPVVEKYDDVHHLEEAVFLAFELIRFGNLNSRNPHTELVGGPLRGSDEQKASCLLISRIACLLKVRHNRVGYTGPLSKNFLSYYSIIKAVRETDRDLLEAITVSLFLSNQADRDRKDYRELGQKLAFGVDISIGLGIAVKTYLDDYLKLNTTKDEREQLKAGYAEKYLPHGVNIPEDLDVAFKFFYALYAGVMTLGSAELSSADRKVWEDAKAYLDVRI